VVTLPDNVFDESAFEADVDVLPQPVNAPNTNVSDVNSAIAFFFITNPPLPKQKEVLNHKYPNLYIILDAYLI
jgi:hypothetical protein